MFTIIALFLIYSVISNLMSNLLIGFYGASYIALRDTLMVHSKQPLKSKFQSKIRMKYSLRRITVYTCIYLS